jgi:type 1 fimbria pilin
MENTAVEGAATGISAQIQADARRSVVNSTLLSSIVPSGEWYVTSGLSSNNQSLSYKVNLIVNGDTVSPGNFGTSAVVTVSYL